MNRIDRLFSSREFSVDWNVGKRCNYDCTYCPSSLHDNSSNHISYEQLCVGADNVLKISNNLDKYPKIFFTGGEPTVNPSFEKLLVYLNDIGIKHVGVTTNGTRKPAWYIKNSIYISSLSVSLHYEYDWNKVLETIVSINKHFKRLTVNILAHYQYYEQVVYTIDTLNTHNVKYRVKKIRWSDYDLYLTNDYEDDKKYSTDFLNFINSIDDNTPPDLLVDNKFKTCANDLIKDGRNKFINWLCYAGVEGISIASDGSVYRGACQQGGLIGNIYDVSLSYNIFTPITCKKKTCNCIADVEFTKRLQ